jgi:hypothetical protein
MHHNYALSLGHAGCVNHKSGIVPAETAFYCCFIV